MDVETVVGQPALEGHRVVGSGVGCVRVSALREKSGPRMTASGACASMAHQSEANAARVFPSREVTAAATRAAKEVRRHAREERNVGSRGIFTALSPCC